METLILVIFAYNSSNILGEVAGFHCPLIHSNCSRVVTGLLSGYSGVNSVHGL